MEMKTIFLPVPLSHVECKDDDFNSISNKTELIIGHVEFKQFSTTKIRNLKGQEITLKDQTTRVLEMVILMPDLLNDEINLKLELCSDMHELHEIDADACSYMVTYLTSYAKKVDANRGVDYEGKLIEIKACFNRFVMSIHEERDEDLFELSCPICLDDLSARADCTRTACSHIFHEFCILPWLERTDTCPVCRSKNN